MQGATLLHLFNPDNDLALANGDVNYIPPQSARQMADDLALLPAWYAHPCDFLLLPDSDGLYYWRNTLPDGLPLPRVKAITPKEDIPPLVISPWGWNPALVKKLSLMGVSPSLLLDEEEMGNIRKLSSRLTAVHTLKELMQRHGYECPVIGESVACHTLEEVETTVAAWGECLLKAPWSSSGKGLRRASQRLTSSSQGWVVRTLAQQEAVVVEPLYDKVLDFAMEFIVTDTIRFFSYSYFMTDDNGAYKGNLLADDKRIEELLAAYVPHAVLDDICHTLMGRLGELAATNRYHGFIGVDMMVCRTSDGEYRLHPCVEINWRMNMGVVARMVYDRYVETGHTGRFFVEYHPTNEALKEQHLLRAKKHPIKLTADAQRVCAGYQPLTPIGRNTRYLAGIIVEDIIL